MTTKQIIEAAKAFKDIRARQALESEDQVNFILGRNPNRPRPPEGSVIDPALSRGPIGFIEQDPAAFAKGIATAPFTAAPDILGLAQQGMNALGNVAQERLGLPQVGFDPISGDPIREATGLDVESPQGLAGEVASPVGTAAKGLGIAAKSVVAGIKLSGGFPLAPIGRWLSGADFEARGGRITKMAPDEFLNNAAPLQIDDLSRENIDDLKRHINEGGELDPLELFSGDRSLARNSDGRHRAIAARELGIDEVPVVDFRPQLKRFTPAKSLTEAERGIETRFAQQLADNSDEAAQQYRSLPSTKDGKIISVDDIRELDPTYRQDRSLSAAVHEPASAYAKDLWDAKLAEPGTGDIMLMSGGTGAGKSTALELLGAEQYHGIFDSNLSDFTKAKARIKESLDTGRNVDIAHIWRDPVEAFSGEGGSAITRAMRNNGNGRTVPIKSHVDTHVGSNKVIKQLQEFYKGDDRVRIIVIDNSRGKNNAIPSDTSVIQAINPDRLKEQLIGEANKALETGRINEKTFQGFTGRTNQATGAGVSRQP